MFSLEDLSGDLDRWSTLSDEAFSASLIEAGLSDGLPVARPTSSLVENALRLNGYEADDTLAVLPPLGRPVSAKAATIQALMAGCLPEHVPVVAATLRGLQDPRLNALGVVSTTGSAAFMLLINGPIVSKLGFNAKANCLGPGNRSNAVVGRAFSLIMRNVGGAIPGKGDMSTMGQPGKYTFCFAENEEETPWQPFHVERGFSHNQSTVTLFAVAGTVEVVDTHSITAKDRLQILADVIANPIGIKHGAEVLVGSGFPTIVMPPESALALHRAGLSKDDTKRELGRRAVTPIERLPPPLQEEIRADRRARMEPVGRPLRVAARCQDICIIVAGGVGMKQTFVPGWNGGSQPVTVAIQVLTPGTA